MAITDLYRGGVEGRSPQTKMAVLGLIGARIQPKMFTFRSVKCPEVAVNLIQTQ